MTTFAALPDAQELEALTCAAWTTYSDELRGLEGQAYADAEIAAWDRLQADAARARGARARRCPRRADPGHPARCRRRDLAVGCGLRLRMPVSRGC